MVIVMMVVATGTFGYLSVSTAQEEKNLERIISNAKTAADHEAIAAYYEKEAQALHAKHAEHQKMSEWYKKNPTVNKSGFSTPCDIIAANDNKTAKERSTRQIAQRHGEVSQIRRPSFLSNRSLREPCLTQ